MTLTDKLNEYEVSCKSAGTNRDGAQEFDLEAAPEDDSLFDEEGYVTDADFSAFLEELDTYTVTAEDHPVDRRAGLVYVVRHNGEAAYYDEVGDCCWKEAR